MRKNSKISGKLSVVGCSTTTDETKKLKTIANKLVAKQANYEANNEFVKVKTIRGYFFVLREKWEKQQKEKNNCS